MLRELTAKEIPKQEALIIITKTLALIRFELLYNWINNTECLTKTNSINTSCRESTQLLQ